LANEKIPKEIVDLGESGKLSSNKSYHRQEHQEPCGDGNEGGVQEPVDAVDQSTRKTRERVVVKKSGQSRFRPPGDPQRRELKRML
jgi:hypothetical protein